MLTAHVPAQPVASPVTPAALRAAMSRFTTGVVVLTTGGGHVHGMTANAFSSVSLDPPLVLCCIAHSAVMHEALLSAGTFGVSVLRAGQGAVATHFADKKRPLGLAQFAGHDWTEGDLTGVPLLGGALAWLECSVTDVHPAGDHSVVVGTVLGASTGDDAGSLAFYQGAFHEVPAREPPL